MQENIKGDCKKEKRKTGQIKTIYDTKRDYESIITEK